MSCIATFALITVTLSISAHSSPMDMLMMCPASPCSGECGPTQTPFPTARLGAVVCYCDRLCPLFGDCCPSYEDNSCSEQEDQEVVRKSEFMTCGAKIEAFMKMPAIYFVNKCPMASSEKWRQLCEKDSSSGDSLVLHVPAFETRTRIVYRNMYCLQCHGIGLRESEYWFNLYQSERILQQRTEFANMTIHLQAANFLLKFGYHVVLDTLFGEGLAVTRHDHLFYRRCMDVYMMLQCYTGQDPESHGALLGKTVSYHNYDYCPAGAENELANNCALYDNPVTSGPQNDVTWFKNEYCAQCQNYTVNDCSRVADDMMDLPCPTWTGPPWDLGRMFLPPVPCALGDCEDPIDGSRRQQVVCRPGQVYWQDECILDPYSDVYTSPGELDSRSGIQWILALTLRGNFYILDKDKSVLETETINTFAEILRNEIESVLPSKQVSTFIRPLKEPQSSTPVLGGWQYFMPEKSELEFLFHNGINLTQIGQLLAIRMNYERIEGIFNDTLRHDSYNRLRILTRNVEHPIRCERGDMVNVSMEVQIGEKGIINITDKVLLYMQHASDAHERFGRVLVDYNMNTSSISVYLCDTTPVMIKACPLLNYTMENFTLHAGNLLHTPTGHIFTEGSFFVDRNEVFVCVTDFEVDPILFYVNVAGFVISDVFLLYSIVTHLILPELRTLPGLMIMNLCGSLFVSQVLFLIGVVLDGVAMSCLVIAAMLHYAWLSTFLWMNSIAFSTWLTFRQKIVTTSKSRKSLVLYSVYSYVVPAFVVGICLTLHFTGQVSIYAAGLNGNTSPGICWIYNENVRNYAFMLPLGMVVLANILLFSSTAYNIRNIQKDVKFATTSPLDVVLYFKMSFLLGFSWLFGILGALIPNPVFEYLFIVLSSATGILVGASFTCTERVFKMYKRRLRPDKSSCDSRRSATSKTGTGSATVNSTSMPQPQK